MKRRGRKPKRQSADHLLDFIGDGPAKAFVEAFGNALMMADCPEPFGTAQAILELHRQRANPSVMEMSDRAAGLAGLDHATFSARLTGGFDHRMFGHELSRLMVKRIAEVYEAHGRPPIVDCAADAHEHELWAMSEREFQKGKRRRPRKKPRPEGHIRATRPCDRRHWLFKCTASNKKAIWCTKYLLMVVTWEHNGERVYYPAMFRIIPRGADNPLQHARAIIRTLNALRTAGVPVRSVLLDRWYDSHELRRTIRQAGHGCVTRMRINLAQRRIVWAEDDAELDIVEILKELAKDARVAALELQEDALDLEGGWITFKRSKPRVMVVRLEREGPLVKLCLRAAVRLVEGDWVLDGRLCSIIAADVDIDLDYVSTLYPIRWVAELFLARTTEDKPKDRPKRIETEVAVLTGVVCWTGIVLETQHMLRTQARGQNLLGVPIERYSKRALGHVLLPLRPA